MEPSNILFTNSLQTASPRSSSDSSDPLRPHNDVLLFDSLQYTTLDSINFQRATNAAPLRTARTGIEHLRNDGKSTAGNRSKDRTLKVALPPRSLTQNELAVIFSSYTSDDEFLKAGVGELTSLSPSVSPLVNFRHDGRDLGLTQPRQSINSEESSAAFAPNHSGKPRIISSEGESFDCPSCGKNYKRKGDLKFHVLHKHPDDPSLSNDISKPKSSKDGKLFPCPVANCKCGFRWERDLRRHIKGKHADFVLVNPETPAGYFGFAPASTHAVRFNNMNMAEWQALPKKKY